MEEWLYPPFPIARCGSNPTQPDPHPEEPPVSFQCPFPRSLPQVGKVASCRPSCLLPTTSWSVSLSSEVLHSRPRPPPYCGDFSAYERSAAASLRRSESPIDRTDRTSWEAANQILRLLQALGTPLESPTRSPHSGSVLIYSLTVRIQPRAGHALGEEIQPTISYQETESILNPEPKFPHHPWGGGGGHRHASSDSGNTFWVRYPNGEEPAPRKGVTLFTRFEEVPEGHLRANGPPVGKPTPCL